LQRWQSSYSSDGAEPRKILPPRRPRIPLHSLRTGHPSSHDYSRTGFESRVAFGGPDEDAEEVATPTRQFSLLEITSGLPDDSREADERVAERRLRDFRARVKAARAVVATTPGLTETLARDGRKAARFYARFGIAETLFRQGGPSPAREVPDHSTECLQFSFEWLSETRTRTEAQFPSEPIPYPK